MDLHFTIVAGDGISIRMTKKSDDFMPPAFHDLLFPDHKYGDDKPKAEVIDLAKAREKRKCKRCNGIGIMAVEVPLESFTDCIGVEGRTCSDCGGKGFR